LITVSRDLYGRGVRIAYALVSGVRVGEPSEALTREARRVEEGVRSRFRSPSELTGDERVRALRSFLWSLGIDPTKVRPSSEALARRIVRGSSLPRINNVVDAGNIASVETIVPIGLYDADRLEFPLELRLCEGPCEFEPIGGGTTVLKPGTPVLVDARGRVVHVFPHRDSRETMIREGTRRVLIVAAGVPGFSEEELLAAVERVISLLRLDGQDLVVEVEPRLAGPSSP